MNIKSKYALGTDVTAEKSKGQIEKTLRGYGASGVMQGWDGNNAFVAFIHGKFQVRIFVPLPPKETQIRQRYRVLLIGIKAKFEAIACGIKTFEEEFLSDIVMPNGQTVGQTTLPAIRHALSNGKMPVNLLPMLEAPK